MPYTKEELLTNEFWQNLHEQDRVDYLDKLGHAELLQDAREIIDINLGILPVSSSQPLRNDVGTFLAFEDPDSEEHLSYNRPDQYITIDKKSPLYYKGNLWDQVLDREFEELI